MYERYFDLKERPFASVPRPDHYFPAAAIEGSRVTLARCVDRAEGAAIVVGPSGTGKTLLCRLLAEQFKGTFQVAMLTNGRLATRGALLQAILYELHQPYRGMDESELRLALIDRATLADDCGRGIVLLADEAHNLPLRLLDELRMLTNLVREGQPAVRLVLAGDRSLEERFASPRLDSFSQRLAARCYLEAFQRVETEQYIYARIAAAGGPAAQIFPPETCQSVYNATDGVPRLINQVCDHVLLLAAASGLRRIEPAHVEQAWADLQQLPTPLSDAVRNAEPGVIEFGGLQDEPDGDCPDFRGHQAQLGRENGTVPFDATDEDNASGDSARPVLRISPETEPSDALECGEREPAAELGRIQQILAEVDDEFQPVGAAQPDVELPPDEPQNPFNETFAEEEIVADRYVPARDRLPPAEAFLLPEEAPTVSLTNNTAPGETRPGEQQAYTEEAATDEADTVAVAESAVAPWPVRSVAAVRRQEFGRLFAKLRRIG